MNKDFTTDGASLPRFFRRWIQRHYPAEVIQRIDRAGVYHDWLTHRYPNTRRHNRRRFIRQLRRYSIPNKLIHMIHVGLWLYDHCPQWLRTQLRKLT